tara:strand:- start:593 stop:826 length:234 start_codon:yes stop_codon:yes gene_type:complete
MKSMGEIMEQLLADKYGPLMSVEDYAELFKVSKKVVYSDIANGSLPVQVLSMKGRKKYLFATPAVAAFLEKEIQNAA